MNCIGLFHKMHCSIYIMTQTSEYKIMTYISVFRNHITQCSQMPLNLCCLQVIIIIRLYQSPARAGTGIHGAQLQECGRQDRSAFLCYHHLIKMMGILDHSLSCLVLYPPPRFATYWCVKLRHITPQCKKHEMNNFRLHIAHQYKCCEEEEWVTRLRDEVEGVKRLTSGKEKGENSPASQELIQQRRIWCHWLR